MLLVERPTGIVYEQQCGGHLNEVRSAEGFLVPVGDAMTAAPLRAWFASKFRGNPERERWNVEDEDQLDQLLHAVREWPIDRREGPWPLALDRTRLAELTEAWVPVTSEYGPAVLLFRNSD